ncbi:hypothetical protein [Brevundimonas sp.]|uniref:hypothetical protein n=1 Tax=Brevundimonas sp. TaxID=1871086 RepID=UPI002FCA29A7
MRVVVYDPALEPLKIVPWDAQTHTGPEAPARNQTWVRKWARLTAADGVNPRGRES